MTGNSDNPWKPSSTERESIDELIQAAQARPIRSAAEIKALLTASSKRTRSSPSPRAERRRDLA